MLSNKIPQEIRMSLNSLHITGFYVDPYGIVFNVMLINGVPLIRLLGKYSQSTVKLTNQEGLFAAFHTVGRNNLGGICSEI